MRAIVNPEVCIGCTLCTQVCPEVFRMEGEKAVAFTPTIPEGVKETCSNTAEQCPVGAIRIEE